VNLERVAAAPISWGVCEVPGWGHQLAPLRYLQEVGELGLHATELGPRGFLPEDPYECAALLHQHGLRLVGGFVPAVLHEPAIRVEQLAAVEASARTLQGGGAHVLVLAAATGLEAWDRTISLDATAWKALASGIGAVEEIADRHGLVVALHPHYGTVVQTAQQVERLLEASDVNLCIDTGHLMVGGADPVEVTRASSGRVRHVHLKDVDPALAARVLSGEVAYPEAVRQGIYCPLGRGGAGIAEIVTLLEGAGYLGWYVLEQDVMLDAEPPLARGPVSDVAASLAFLHGLESPA